MQSYVNTINSNNLVHHLDEMFSFVSDEGKSVFLLGKGLSKCQGLVVNHYKGTKSNCIGANGN